MKTVLIVDGICPRGLAIIRYLSLTGEYHILAFTKTTTCPGANAASSLPNVTLLLNCASTGYDLQTFVAAAQRCPYILICSNVANSEGSQGVQWGARLIQLSANAGAKHIAFITMEPERKQASIDGELPGSIAYWTTEFAHKSIADFVHTQAKPPLNWTIIRSPAGGVSSQLPSSAGLERSLSATQLSHLAYYVAWAFSHPERSSSLDFTLPIAKSSDVRSALEAKRRDSKTEDTTTARGHGAGQSSRGSSASRVNPPPRASSRTAQLACMEPGRAQAIRQWAAKASPEKKAGIDESGEEDETDDESLGSETD